MTNLIVRRNVADVARMPTEPFDWLPWDPFRTMAPIVAAGVPVRFTPNFEIKETKGGFIFRADVPGIRDRDLEITMTGNRLTISGKRQAEKGESTDTYYARECSYGGFTRVFTLPEGTDGNNQIRAELNQGVLTLLLPKRPELQPRRIEVKVTDKPKS